MDDPLPHLFTTLWFHPSALLDPVVLGSLLGMAALLLLSALVAAAEVSYFSLEPSHLETLANSQERRDRLVTELWGRQKRLIATIVIAHNLVNIGVIVLSETVSKPLLAGIASPPVEFMVRVILVTFLILLIGEVMPKLYTKQDPLTMARRLAYPLAFADRLFKPLSSLLLWSTSALDRLVKQPEHNLSVDDLSQALELTSNEHTPEEERKILQGIVDFGNTDVRQIMKPRLEIIALDERLNFTQVLEQVMDAGFSRIPVYREHIDQVVGILYAKDLLPHLSASAEFDWHSLLRPTFFVPMNKKIDDLLREFQSKKMHMAIVSDEYGGTNGLITLEDVIEEVMGDINDEFDDDELVYSRLDDRNVVFEAKIMLNDLYKILDIDGDAFEAKKGDSDTLAGFILELTGKIPEKGEVVAFEGYRFTVEAVDRRRIKRVKVTLPAPAGSASMGMAWLAVGLCLLQSACTQTYTPKPKGYPRLALPAHTYAPIGDTLPYSFEAPTYAHLEPYRGGQLGRYWTNLEFRGQKATLFLSYFPVQKGELNRHLEDARSLAYKHTVKASSIDETLLNDPSRTVYGMMYTLGGAAASPMQFYATDSTRHFLRGALYFNLSPNPDSLEPVTRHLEADLAHLLNTLKWR